MGIWDTWSDSDLGVVAGGTASVTWCQETALENSSERVTIGGGAVGASGRFSASLTDTVFGWRPVLEVV